MRLLDRAIALDPNYAHAHAWKACVLGQAWTYGWCQDREYAFKTVLGELQTALALDDNDSDVHRILAALHLARNEHDKAAYHQQRALSLNPNDDLIVVQQGEMLTWLGQPEEGVEWIRKAMRLNPFHSDRFWSHLARAYFGAHRYAEAVEAVQHIAAPTFLHHAFLAACHAQLGDAAAAESHLREVLKEKPRFRIETNYLPLLHYKREADRAYARDSLRKAGFRD
jgi:adenylate cyclase